MAEWVLIVFMAINHGGAAFTQVFTSQARCEAARAAVMDADRWVNYQRHRVAICVER